MWGYIQNKAKETLGGQNGAVDSETVFSWALHYMVESNEELAKEMPQPKAAEENKKSNKHLNQNQRKRT